MGEISAGSSGECGERQYPMPSVVEEDPGGERVYDLYSLLIKNRIVFVGTPIDHAVANLVAAELLFLQHDDPGRSIEMYVNSPGGDVDAGLAMYDAMHLVRPRIATICVGVAVGIAALIVAGGARGQRTALANARMMIHQPSSQLEGVAADIDVHAREIVRLNARLIELLAGDTSQPVGRVAGDLNRDFWLNAEEALSYGLVDDVLGRPVGGQLREPHAHEIGRT
jgi:ATP-dependent Clp protease protease subunit